MIQYPRQPLARVLKRIQDAVEIYPEEIYKQVTVRLFHKGVILRGVQKGSAIRTTRQWRVRTGQVLLSRIDARNGAIGLVPSELDGAIVTNDFWAFEVNKNLAYSKLLDLYFGTSEFVESCQVASEGTTNRVRLQPDRFLQIKVPLPPLDEQRSIIARIEELSAKIEEAREIRDQIEKQRYQLLMAAYRQITDDAPHKPMREVAPLERRSVIVEAEKEYPQVAVRSFGRGTFHRQPLRGSEVTWQKPYLVRAGDILISNIKAWEGAIAVALSVDDGRVGSHRYLTCVPIPNVATPNFVCFHLLTPEGLLHVGEASPGTADRNRTLNIKALLEIPIPTPSFEKQMWFETVYRQIAAMKNLQDETAEELSALMPSILSRVFSSAL